MNEKKRGRKKGLAVWLTLAGMGLFSACGQESSTGEATEADTPPGSVDTGGPTGTTPAAPSPTDSPSSGGDDSTDDTGGNGEGDTEGGGDTGGEALPDTDEDTVPDAQDNCPLSANQNQIDLDGDGAGDVCDNDIDGDGFLNGVDDFPTDPAEHNDNDDDDIGDNADPDDDNDGVLDVVDNCPMTFNPGQEDLNENGIGDACDNDADGDGLAKVDDCDDNNPDIHPGADDIPDAPNFTDTNCDGVDGNKELAFWVAPDGNDNDNGTIDRPFATMAKGILEAQASEGKRPVYVVEGNYQESPASGDAGGYIGVNLFGGYGPLNDADDTRPRSLETHISHFDRITIDGGSGLPSNGMETLVDGFFLSKVIISDAAPTFSNNNILYDIAVCDGGAAVNISASAARTFVPQFIDNVIENPECLYSDLIPAIVAVEMVSRGASRLEPFFDDNRIRAAGGGVDADIVIAVRGAALEDSNLDPDIHDNNIDAEQALIYAAGVNIFADNASAEAEGDVLENDIRLESAPSTFGVDIGFDGLNNGFGVFKMTQIGRNTILGGLQSDFSAGISLSNGSLLHSLIQNNFIHAGLGSSFADGILVQSSAANIISNTLVADAADTGTGIDLLPGATAAHIDSNVFFGNANQDIGVSASADGPPATLVRNLFDPTIDVLFTSAASGNVTTLAGLTAVNAAFTPNTIGSALLTDPANLDFHLLAGSAAIDAHASGSFPARDIDNDSRPQGAAFDIGADEKD